jgi:hypothetical protein
LGRERVFESYRADHSRSEGRDCTIESGGPVVGGYRSNREEISAKDHGATETQNISGRQEKNRGGTERTLGKNQGSKEGVTLAKNGYISGQTIHINGGWFMS